MILERAATNTALETLCDYENLRKKAFRKAYRLNKDLTTDTQTAVVELLEQRFEQWIYDTDRRGNYVNIPRLQAMACVGQRRAVIGACEGIITAWVEELQAIAEYTVGQATGAEMSPMTVDDATWLQSVFADPRLMEPLRDYVLSLIKLDVDLTIDGDAESAANDVLATLMLWAAEHVSSLREGDAPTRNRLFARCRYELKAWKKSAIATKQRRASMSEHPDYEGDDEVSEDSED